MKRQANSATAVHRDAGPITILAAYRIALYEAKTWRTSQKKTSSRQSAMPDAVKHVSYLRTAFSFAGG